jgi:hypothetical protein
MLTVHMKLLRKARTIPQYNAAAERILHDTPKDCDLAHNILFEMVDTVGFEPTTFCV